MTSDEGFRFVEAYVSYKFCGNGEQLLCTNDF